MMGFESLFSHPLIHALVWALLHFIWQGAVVAILLAGALFLLQSIEFGGRPCF